MEQRVKQRLVGAVILVALAVIFIPMLLKGPVEGDRASIPVEVPAPPRVKAVPDIPETDALDARSTGQQPAELPPSDSVANGESALERRSSSPPVERSGSSSTASEPAAPPRAAPAKDAPEAATSAWAVQIGSFRDRENASALRQELRASGFSTYIEQTRYRSKPVYRVRVGPVIGRGKAEQLAARLHEERGIKGLVVGK